MKKVFGAIAAVLLLFLLIVYGCGCYYFRSHFYYGTQIDGTIYGCLDEPQVRADLIGKYENYELIIYGRKDLTESLGREQAGCSLEPQEELQRILDGQLVYLWPISFFEAHIYELTDSVKIEEEAFQKAIGNLAVFDAKNIEAPVNARLSDYSAARKGYYIIEETEGTQIRREKTAAAIREALEDRRSELTLTDDFYDEPAIRSDNEALVQRMERLNAWTGLTFTYDMHGVEAVLDGDRIHEWLIEQNGTVTLDEEQAKAYVQELADTYDTYGKVRTFTTVGGRELELRSGAYGWKLDVAAEQEAILNMLNGKKSASREPEWTKKGYVEGESDIGDNYVEIDLGRQHLYVIQEGKIVLESDFVSGNMARGWGTPSGVFGITYKTRNAVLRGADYATPVSFWIPFNRNIGMHDATWRGSFGGQIYQTNGSHGCINLPYSKAKEIYNLVETNMPVVCYY